MEHVPYISVIVAVYNVAKWMRKCIEGILAQTFLNFELILVDDGSTDESPSICDEYACQDNRIRVIHKTNGGVASARQVGLEAAQGEYVIHVDPDDWSEPDMLEKMYRYARETQSDMLICDFWMEFQNGRPRHYFTQNTGSLDGASLFSDLIHNRIYGSVWNKLIKRELLVQNGIHFPVGLNYCEDLYVTAWCATLAKKIAYLPEAFYHYQTSMPQSLVDDARNKNLQYSLLFHKNCLMDYPQPYREDAALLYERRTWRTLLQNGTKEELHYFDQSFNYLRNSYWRLGGSLFQKILLFLAFHISSHLAQRLLSFRLIFGKP